MSKCLNCNSNCEEKFCDALCHYGFTFRAYRELQKEKED